MHRNNYRDKIEISCPHCNKNFSMEVDTYLDLAEVRCKECSEPIPFDDLKHNPKFVKGKKDE
jgi:hypothetical protein